MAISERARRMDLTEPRPGRFGTRDDDGFRKGFMPDGQEPWRAPDWPHETWDRRNESSREGPRGPPPPRPPPLGDLMERAVRGEPAMQHSRGRSHDFDPPSDERDLRERPLDDAFDLRDRDDFGGRGRPEFRGRGRPEFLGRGRGEFGDRAEGMSYGRGPAEFRGRGDFMSDRGRLGRGGRGRWIDDGPFLGQGRGFPDERVEYGPLRGREDFPGRGFRGRGRMRYEGREGRSEWQDGPRQPSIDPALLERRRASNKALLKHQVKNIQVSKDLLDDEEAAELYNKITEGSSSEARDDIRGLYTYPLFSAEDPATTSASLQELSDQSQAFEQCLLMYQEAQTGLVVIQSDHGNFLHSSADGL